MGRASGVIGRIAVAASLVVLAISVPAGAEVTTERGSSIIIFPKVLSDRDGLQTGGFPVETEIQISNVSNSLAFAHCFYVNASPLDPAQPTGVFNPPQCQEVDFDIMLTKQQPTHWVVGVGRRLDPTDRQCSWRPPLYDCDGAGFDPGLIPAVTPNFTGFLVCVEVDSSGAPLNGNRLKGLATLVTPQATTTSAGFMPLGEVSKYNAIGIPGLNTDTNSNNGDFNLCIGGGVRDGCPAGAEYAACPDAVILNHFGEGASQPALNNLGAGPSAVRTDLTLVPCTQDFENQIPGSVVVQFKVTNEFEELFSASTTVSCWANLRLLDISRIFDTNFLGTRFAQTRLTPGGSGQPGFIGVAEEFQAGRPGGRTNITRAAFNLHGEGDRPDGESITIPEVEP